MCAPHPDEIYERTVHWQGQNLSLPVETLDTTIALVEKQKPLPVRKAIVPMAIQAVFMKIGRMPTNSGQ